MDPNTGTNYPQSEEDQQLKRQLFFQIWKERLYKFFYAIWPSVNRVIAFFLYHTLRIIKGSVKTAMEQFHR